MFNNGLSSALPHKRFQAGHAYENLCGTAFYGLVKCGYMRFADSDIETIDDELRLAAVLRRAARERGAAPVSIGYNAKDVVLSGDPDKAAKLDDDDDAMDELHAPRRSFRRECIHSVRQPDRARPLG